MKKANVSNLFPIIRKASTHLSTLFYHLLISFPQFISSQAAPAGKLFTEFADTSSSESTSWFDATLWTEHPGAFDVVNVDTPATVVTIDGLSASSAQARQLALGDTAGNDVQMDILSSSRGLNVEMDLAVGLSQGMEGSVHSGTAVSYGEDLVVGDQGFSLFDIHGGIVTVGGKLMVSGSRVIHLYAGSLRVNDLAFSDGGSIEMHQPATFAIDGDHLETILGGAVVSAVDGSQAYAVYDCSKDYTIVHAI